MYLAILLTFVAKRLIPQFQSGHSELHGLLLMMSLTTIDAVLYRRFLVSGLISMFRTVSKSTTTSDLHSAIIAALCYMES